MIRIILILLSILLNIKQLQACTIDIYANDGKPNSYLEKGQAKGIFIEMMDYIGADIGCKFTYHVSTWARAYKSMLGNKGGVIGLSWNSSREDIIDYSDVMYNEEVLFVTHTNTPFTLADINDLAGKTVSSSRGSKLGDQFDKAIKENIFTFIGDNGDLVMRLKRVAKGRLDVAILRDGLYAFNNLFKEHPELADIKDRLYIVPSTLNKDPNYLGFAKSNDHKDFLKKFNESMKKARNAGVIQAIEGKYLH